MAKWNEIVKIVKTPKLWVISVFAFASGLPSALTGGTLQAWMASEGVDLPKIGIFSLVGLPFTIKFLWAPLMDRYVPPFLGRRRGWIFIIQGLLCAGLVAMGQLSPKSGLVLLGVIAFSVSFFSASQDIVIDAYRVEVLKPSERGFAAGVSILGYRVAMIVSGAGSLILSDHMSWGGVYAVMGAMFLVLGLFTFFAPEPQVAARPPASLAEAVIDPLKDFFKRAGAFEVLAFIVLYKLGDVLTGIMTTPFLIGLEFSRTEIGAINKGVGLFSTIIGALAGGAWMLRLGMNRALLVFGLFQMFSNLMFLLLALMGKHHMMLVATILVENLAGGMGTAAFTAFLMSLCNTRFTASQYALLSSFTAIARVFLGVPSGFVAKAAGWEMYFLICTLIAIPGLIMIRRFKHWKLPTQA